MEENKDDIQLKKTDGSLPVRQTFTMLGKERFSNLHIVWGTSGAQAWLGPGQCVSTFPFYTL